MLRGLSHIAPFLMSAIFFQSAWFAFVSPLPLFILTLRNRLWVSVIALFTNLAFLSIAAPPTELYVAGGLWIGVGILFPSCIRKFGKIHLSFGISFLFLVTLLLGALYIHARSTGLNMIEYLRSEINVGMDHLIQLPDSPVKKLVEEEGREALFRQLMTELPSGILIGVVFCLWVNLLFASQLIRGFLSRTFWATYRNPEWLVYPTLVFAGLYALADHAPFYIGLNGLKLTLTFYGLQGLSIISNLLNRYKILGIGRVVAFSLAVFVALPLVLALGFFDLWFDFRKKFGHS